MNSKSFYNCHSGHSLNVLYNLIKKFAPYSKIVFLAGDSSLYKFWILDQPTKKAVNYYQLILIPPEMKPDICYQLNYLLRGSAYICIHCAVYDSTLWERIQGNMMAQDLFIQQNIKPNDVLIVSMGSNDILYKPTFTTLYYLILLISLNTIENIKSNPLQCWGFRQFMNLFKNQITHYIERLIALQKPKLVIVCMFDYSDENWTDVALSYLGYKNHLETFQIVIEQMYKYTVQKIFLPGVEIRTCPMFQIPNKPRQDYDKGVESRKIAKILIKLIFQSING